MSKADENVVREVFAQWNRGDRWVAEVRDGLLVKLVNFIDPDAARSIEKEER